MSEKSPQTTPQFYIFECSNSTCRLRFPFHQLLDQNNVVETIACPICKATAQRVSAFNPPVDEPKASQLINLAAQQQRPIELLIDNVRSLFNVGSIFRTADATGVQHIHLCGITPTPDHPKLAKTALGAEQAIPWTYHKNGLEAVTQLKEIGYKIWGLEESVNSQDLYQGKHEGTPSPIVLMVGNELSGIDPELLSLCDAIYHLPMNGTKRSLNVAVAFGAAIYHIQFGLAQLGPQ